MYVRTQARGRELQNGFTYWGLSEYTLTACSTERLDFLVLTNDICTSSSTEKLNKTGTSLVSILYKKLDCQ